jgi:NTP pyrophosphatase (non-canonical NTP hydrolase)
MNDHQNITQQYLEAVGVARRQSREQWGDDYTNGKSAGFLITVLIAAIGEVADAVIGNASDDTMQNAIAAQELMIDVGGICVSLYEWMDKKREAIASEYNELM